MDDFLQLSPHFTFGEMTRTDNRNLIEKNKNNVQL